MLELYDGKLSRTVLRREGSSNAPDLSGVQNNNGGKMQFIPNTILGFFDSSQKSYEIPVYQRAYSWEKQNWETFLDDLLEQIEGHHNYFFGNLLLEVIKKNRKYEIIDGQQRITTLTIFMRALLNVLKDRDHEPDSLCVNIAETPTLC